MNIVLRLAWRNIWRQPRRTWLTTGAMVFSNILLVFMISLQFGMYGLMINNTLQVFSGHMQVQAPGYVDDAKMRQVVDDVQPLAAHLREALGSDTVAARARAFALASSEDRTYGIAIYGVEPRHEPRVSNLPGLVEHGRYLQDDDAYEIVIGSVLARNLQVATGDELTLLGSGVDGSFAAAVVVVAGIFESGVKDIDRNIAQMPLTAFQDMFYMNGAGHQVVILAPSLADAPELQARVEALVGADDGLVVQDWDALQPGLRQAIQADMSSAFFMYGILVVLVAFSVLNTQLMSVLERTHEFGVVMALGMKPGLLGRIVLLESALMGLLGFVLGVIAGTALTAWLSVRGFTMPGMDEMAAQFNLPARIYPPVTLLSVAIGPFVVFVFTLLASVYPAWRLRRLHPVEAMRVN
ncbi:MAG: FtsX-like permease family protein [Gammaproteobacteria bacterium]|nr:FtsX-like permease family protein [Gammaproteobacteria bacterium]NNF50621.1 ABC transporter permease [Woeseiaceae bacterium]MBT8094030.1 FtsX-like permease family protein [Gammaproteobacteria bacterium]MBT8105689.1 FtsX-like permease family protein [Gammaproteobacteria bacterium]NNK25703.1 ABC transporter permease [Woeseiaceae bacterium]